MPSRRQKRSSVVLHLFFLLFPAISFGIVAGSAYSGEAGSGAGGMAGLLGEGIDFRGGMLDWEEDEQGHRIAILRNYAVIVLPQVTVSARNMVLNVELQEIYAEGDVVFDDPNGNAFYCDQLSFNYQEWKGLAKNVRLKMDNKNVRLPVKDFLDEAPSLDMTRAQSLSSTQDAGPIRRMFVHAQELRAHDSETFELIDAKITPDSFARPKWYFNSPAALLRRNEKIESYHNTVRVGNMPVLYFPYLIRDLQYDWPWMRFSAGHTSDLGYFARTQWGWKLRNDNPNRYFRMDKVIFDLDYFTERGTGVGVEFGYNMGQWDSKGKLKLYGVYEHAISKDQDYDRAIGDNEDRIYSWNQNWTPSLYRKDFRWAVEWEHYQQLNELWDVRAEAKLYHDRDYLKEYDSSKYWNEKEPQNFVDVRRLDKHWELEFVAQSRLSNKWQTQTAYYPEIRLTVPSLQIGNLPLFFKDDMRVGVVDKYFDEDAVKYMRESAGGIWGLDEWGLSQSRLWDKNHFGAFFRAHNEAILEAPLRVANALTFKPWVGLRTTYYSKTLGTPLPDGELLPADLVARRANVFTSGQLSRRGGSDTNYAVPFGADLSTRFYTVFGAHDQWRLITEPIVSYLENSKPELDYDRNIYPMDEYDVYYRQRRLGFELQNKLQRRYYENASGSVIPTRDILDFSMRFYYYPRRQDQAKINYDRKFTEINFEVTYRPLPRLTLGASIDYDTHDNTVNRAILTSDWRLGNLFRITANHYHYRGRYWRYPYSDQSDQTFFAVRTKLWNDSSHYAIEAAVGYEWRDSNEWRNNQTGVRHGFNQYRVSIFRDLDTFELSVSYVQKRNADDRGVYFTLSPKSFMGMDRPPPLYTPIVDQLAEGRYPDVYYLSDSMIEAPITDADLKDVQF